MIFWDLNITTDPSSLLKKEGAVHKNSSHIENEISGLTRAQHNRWRNLVKAELEKVA